MARHAQITQYNKFVISLRYLKKEVSDLADFLHAHKYESFLQIDSMICDVDGQASQSSQNSKFKISLQYLKKEVRDENYFLHADKHQSFLQVDFNTLGIRVFYKVILSLMGMIKYSQSAQINKVAISLNISKNLLWWSSFFACI